MKNGWLVYLLGKEREFKPVLPQVSMPFVQLLYRFWIDNGVPKKVLDDLLRLDIEQSGLTKFGISSSQLAQLHQAAIEHTNDVSLGIKLGLFIADQDLVISPLVLRAPNLKQGLQALIEYSEVVSESGYFELHPSEQEYQVLRFIPYAGIVFSSHQQNMVFATIISWLKKLFPANQDQINFCCDQVITDVSSYKKLLTCRITPSNEVNLHIPNALLVQANPNFDNTIYQYQLKQVQKILRKRQQRLSLYLDVRDATKRCLLERKATQENVASLLNLSVRNLQRRLKEVGTSYQSILDDSREELAMALLKEADIPLYEIAYLVGFTESSAFYKAFRRWTGKRPGDYRQDAQATNALDRTELNEVLSADE